MKAFLHAIRKMPAMAESRKKSDGTHIGSHRSFSFTMHLSFCNRKMLCRNKWYACLSTRTLSGTQFSDRTQEILPLSTPKMLRRNKRYACLSSRTLSGTQFSDRTQEILPLSTPITEYPLSVHIPMSLITSFVMISPGTMSGASGG